MKFGLEMERGNLQDKMDTNARKYIQMLYVT